MLCMYKFSDICQHLDITKDIRDDSGVIWPKSLLVFMGIWVKEKKKKIEYMDQVSG